MLEVSDLVWFDDPPPHEAARPPLSCRLSLWHRWVRVRVDVNTSCVECERCHRLPTPTIFDAPVP